MNNFGKFASAIVAAVALFALGVFAFVWTCCRVYVGPGEMAIVTSKTGDELPPGAILAEPGQKGVQRIPLGEGRHFLNPVTHDWRIVAAITIPAGSVGVVTSKNAANSPLARSSRQTATRRACGRMSWVPAGIASTQRDTTSR